MTIDAKTITCIQDIFGEQLTPHDFSGNILSEYIHSGGKSPFYLTIRNYHLLGDRIKNYLNRLTKEYNIIIKKG